MPGYGGLAPAAPVAPAPPTGPVSAVFGPPQAQFATPQQSINDAFDQLGFPAPALAAIDTAIGPQVSAPQQAFAAPPSTAPTDAELGFTPGITANDAVSQGFSALGFGTGTLGEPGQGFADGFGAGATGIAGIAPGGFADSGSPGTLGGGYGMGLGNSSVGSPSGAVSGYGFGTVGLSGADAPGPPGFAGDPGATANLGGYGYGITGPSEAAAVSMGGVE